MKKGKYADRISQTAAVCLAAVLEYLVAEILELGGDASKDNRRRRITPRHITLAIQSDHELAILLKDVVISQGGVIPHIESVLLPKNSKPNRQRTNPVPVISNLTVVQEKNGKKDEEENEEEEESDGEGDEEDEEEDEDSNDEE